MTVEIAMTELDALRWCRVHNALVRFHSNQTVEVTVNGYRRRRQTFVEAVLALRAKDAS